MSQQFPSFTVSPSWQKRFDFFNAYGLPNSTPESRAAYRALSFMDRLKLSSNILAFLFGPIYFFVKGMWRKGLTLLGIFFAVEVVLVVLDVPASLVRGIGFGLAALALLIPAGFITWRSMPFEHLRWAESDSGDSSVLGAVEKIRDSIQGDDDDS